MGRDDWTGTVADWLALVDEARSAGDEASPSGELSDVQRQDKATILAAAQQVLDRLADHEVGVAPRFYLAPEIESQVRPFPAGLAATADEAERLRHAMLQLGIWGATGRWARAARAADHDATLIGVIRALGRDPAGIPPGIEASSNYLESGTADEFFQSRLATAVRNLAELFDDHGARFGQALGEARSATGAERHALWNRLWTSAACAAYADYLYRRHRDARVDVVRRGLWQADSVQFRPPPGELVLPAEERQIRLELQVSIVVAQVLQDRETRWQRSDRWHAVSFTFRELHGGDAGDDARGRIPFHTGITVGMLYRAAFIERVESAIASLTCPS